MYQFQVGIKRLLDIVLCLLILILAFPLFLLLALLVRLSSPGPIFFVQERVGWNGKIFHIIKFRTMTGKPEESVTAWTEADEARITPVGGFLRDYGLDELPQVLNILKGDMSIVGPRPPLPAQVENWTEDQRKSLEMRPGVLSLAAIEGRRSIPMKKRIELHAQYVRDWSLELDLIILWRALFVVLSRHGATEAVTESV